MHQQTDELVEEFHAAFGLPIHRTVRVPPIDRVRLRLRLIREEYDEVRGEFETILGSGSNDDKEQAILRLAKELADLRYVIDGAALELGIDHAAAFREVHSSNMSKLDANGAPIFRESDGKVLKGPNYREANIEATQQLTVNIDAA